MEHRNGEAMTLSQETQDLAQRLVDIEVTAGDPGERATSAVIRVCEKLRLPLSAIVGVADYHSLLSRALTLAQLETPSLSAILVTADGSLQDSSASPQVDQQRGGEGVMLLAQLLGLFLAFLGATLTLQLVSDVTDPLAVTAGSVAAVPLTEISREVGQLNNVSCRLESLACEHPILEKALMSISGNIRNTATILEVLAIVRSKPDGLQGDELKQGKRYLM
jgi:hypothetical protein